MLLEMTRQAHELGVGVPGAAGRGAELEGSTWSTQMCEQVVHLWLPSWGGKGWGYHKRYLASFWSSLPLKGNTEF